MAALNNTMARPLETQRNIQIALRLNPTSTPFVAYCHMFLGMAEFHLGHYEAATAWLRLSASELNTVIFTHMHLAAIEVLQGHPESAKPYVDAAMKLMPGLTMKWYVNTFPPTDDPAITAYRAKLFGAMSKAGFPP